MVLSDRTIRRLLDEDRIGIDPYDESLVQPSSVDVRVDRYFRVFRNSRYPFIDVKKPMEDLTELVEIAHERPHGLLLCAQRVDDPPADEPCSPGDEDHSKFFQYLLGVGPAWPWYFEPRPELPYGVSAGSVICTKESWPIFIR